jgi:hypothetical protein
VADDSDIVRRAIRSILATQPEVELVGEAADFAQTIQMANDLKPQVIVMDLHMPDEVEITPQDVKSQRPVSPPLPEPTTGGKGINGHLSFSHHMMNLGNNEVSGTHRFGASSKVSWLGGAVKQLTKTPKREKIAVWIDMAEIEALRYIQVKIGVPVAESMRRAVKFYLQQNPTIARRANSQKI